MPGLEARQCCRSLLKGTNAGFVAVVLVRTQFHQELKRKTFRCSIDGFLEADIPLFLYTASFVRRMETLFCFHNSSLATILTDVLLLYNIEKVHLKSYLARKEGIMLVFNLPNFFGSMPFSFCCNWLQAYNENSCLQSWFGLCLSMLAHSCACLLPGSLKKQC